MRREAVITGYGVVSPFGDGFEEKMFSGASGVSRLTGAPPDFPVHCAAFLPGEYRGPLVDHLFAAYRGADLSGVDAVIYATNAGAAKIADIRRFHAEEIQSFEQFKPELGLERALAHLQKLGAARPVPRDTVVCSNGCINGLSAIHYAAQRIRHGRSRAVLVICEEARTAPEDLLKYHALGALSRDNGAPEKVSRPFSLSRSGFVKGEGAGMLLLEDLSRTRATPWARVAGFGQTSDAWRMTDGREDLAGMTEAIRRALESAGIAPTDVDYVNAHGTSTPKHDRLETEGLKRVLGPHAYNVPVSSLKSQIGHLNFACGMVETIASVAMIRNQRVAPTLNYERDPECDLYYVPERSENRKLRYVLKNSFGFGGANAAMILGSA